jgi:hypothetical protein
MINGAHVILYSKDAEADRAFFATSCASRPLTLATVG